MNFRRHGAMRSAGLIVVAVLAVLALVLIILKFKDSSSGPGVSAVPLTGPQTQRPANNPSAANSPGATGAKKAAAAQVGDRDLEIQVIDAASKQPLEGVELSINMQPGGSRKDRTENRGKAWLMLPPDDPKYLSISAKLSGYVGKHMDWRGEALPATHVIEMEKGSSIGGIVKDEEGNPIRGAGVSVMFPGDSKGARRGMYMSEGPFRTDDEGKWRCDVVPADLTNLSMRLDHPDFVSDESYGATPRPPDAELRAMTAVSVMKRGISLQGVVTNLEGKPIAGASVLQGTDRFGSNQPKVKTDAEGKFAFRNARPGPVVLTVTAKTYAPELKQATVGKDTPPLEIKLGPGNTVKGKVVDRNGKPVAGAFVAADTWRGNRSLDWRVNTKGDGTFVWKEAPADDVLVHLGKPGFQSKRDLHVTPSE
ncbi:MAG TPA: carboxypeptidase-like regulatory domain-containing protein, partial [Tepidisphaeraceae bacterium]|nr:carboxypeptidase-like regulatory domain-containing protein [Tepidisphaeraceae bacterium]